MRVILPHLCKPHLDEVRKLRSKAGDEFLTYGPPGSADLVAGPGWCTLGDIVRQAPRGWLPDAFLAWQIEYNTVPCGIVEADCLTVGVVGDWNLCGQTAHMVGGAFDLLIADEPGCAALRRLGLPNVESVPIWSHDPALHRLVSQSRRDIDVLMIGNLHQDVQRDRARWIARVARLSRKYRVVIATSIVGEEYVRTMNRARIVFNRTLSGAVNMRAYEAAACGALLFHESESPTIRKVFRDREECVLYRDSDLEELLDYYLTHEDERAGIAAAGQRAVANHSHARALSSILDIVQRDVAKQRSHVRPLRALSQMERSLRHASHGSMTVFRTDLPHALAEANAVQAAAPRRADVANARGCILAESALSLQPGPQRAKLLEDAVLACKHAIELIPAYAAARSNLAYVHIVQGDPEAAIKALGQTIAVLHGPDLTPECLMGPYFPRTYDLFTVEVERVWVTHRALSPDWAEEMRSVLAWRTWEVLSDLAFHNKNVDESAQFAAEAVAVRPNFGMTRYRLATALRSLGRLAEAEKEYRWALEDGPLSVPIWQELADVLWQQGKLADCIDFVDDTIAIIDGCPPFECSRAMLEDLARRARQLIIDPGSSRVA